MRRWESPEEPSHGPAAPQSGLFHRTRSRRPTELTIDSTQHGELIVPPVARMNHTRPRA
jgi:hypothetical protein